MRPKETRVFVSYTTRDGCISRFQLKRLRENLSEVCNPYIHALDCTDSETSGQLSVFKKLLTSHLLIIVETPGVYESPWVKLELFLSKLKMTPVIRLDSALVNCLNEKQELTNT